MCLLLGACSSGGSGTDEILPPSESEPEKPLPIVLDCSSTGYAVARATDDGFEAGDAVGVFVVFLTHNLLPCPAARSTR